MLGLWCVALCIHNSPELIVFKEGQLQRLRNERLPSDELKQEADKLTHLKGRINSQEARLQKLKESKDMIKQQVIVNSNMSEFEMAIGLCYSNYGHVIIEEHFLIKLIDRVTFTHIHSGLKEWLLNPYWLLKLNWSLPNSFLTQMGNASLAGQKWGGHYLEFNCSLATQNCSWFPSSYRLMQCI